MGRSFQCVWQGVNSIADSREHASERYQCDKRVVEIVGKYSSGGLVGGNDPPESVLFSITVEMQKDAQKNLSSFH